MKNIPVNSIVLQSTKIKDTYIGYLKEEKCFVFVRSGDKRISFFKDFKQIEKCQRRLQMRVLEFNTSFRFVPKEEYFNKLINNG